MGKVCSSESDHILCKEKVLSLVPFLFQAELGKAHLNHGRAVLSHYKHYQAIEGHQSDSIGSYVPVNVTNNLATFLHADFILKPPHISQS